MRERPVSSEKIAVLTATPRRRACGGASCGGSSVGAWKFVTKSSAISRLS
jgi:hypothetical protein